jgi:hypothetical protein
VIFISGLDSSVTILWFGSTRRSLLVGSLYIRSRSTRTYFFRPKTNPFLPQFLPYLLLHSFRTDLRSKIQISKEFRHNIHRAPVSVSNLYLQHMLLEAMVLWHILSGSTMSVNSGGRTLAGRDLPLIVTCVIFLIVWRLLVCGPMYA